MTTREASKTAKESIPTKGKNNINARNVRFFQSLNSCLTDNTAKTLCCLPTTRRRGRRQTDGKRQRNAKINGRGMRKWVGTAGSPGTGSRKNYQTSGNKHLFKYINIYDRVYQRYTGSEKEKKEKGNRNEIRMRRIKKEECWHRKILKQKRITKAEYKGKEQKREYKEEMKKWYTNAENEWRKICRIQI